MSKIELRPATRNDAADLAILDNLAGHGISLWFWQGAVKMGKSEDAYDFGRGRLADDTAPYGWTNSTIAELDGSIAGAANGYIMSPPDPDDEKQNPSLFVPVFELFCVANGDWLVDSIAVYSQARGQGVGAALLDDCLHRARASSARTVSLVAEDSNTRALNLYRSRGFTERDKRPYIPFNDTSQTKNWLLLSAPIN